MHSTLPDVRIEETPHGRVITLGGVAGRAEVHEHGAHVTSWVPAEGSEALFVSARARFDGKSAIRGGVPVIFPQFGPGPLPKHGFARNRRWSLADAGVGPGGLPYARLVLRDDATTRELWPHRFLAALTVSVGGGLEMVLEVTNTGDDVLAFTGALHSYLRVADVESVQVRGLEGRRMRDKLTRIEAEESSLPVRFAGPIDRVYLDVPGPLRVIDETAGRALRVELEGFRDAVVWNPWEEGSREFDDMDSDEWRTMLCVEPAVAATPVELAPGERWTGRQVLVAE